MTVEEVTTTERMAQGRITIRKELREELGLGSNDLVELIIRKPKEKKR